MFKMLICKEIKLKPRIIGVKILSYPFS